jgi:hypothetical protein
LAILTPRAGGARSPPGRAGGARACGERWRRRSAGESFLARADVTMTAAVLRFVEETQLEVAAVDFRRDRWPARRRPRVALWPGGAAAPGPTRWSAPTAC